MSKTAAVLAIAVALVLGVIIPAPADSLLKNCTYGQLSVYTGAGPDYFFDISNTSGTTKDIRWTLQRVGTPSKIVSVSLGVPNGSKRNISKDGYFIRVEYRTPGTTWWSYGCEHRG